MNPEEMKRRSRGFSTDMSGEAVAKRIEMVSKLRELGLAMKKAKFLGPVSTPTPAGVLREQDPDRGGRAEPS